MSAHAVRFGTSVRWTLTRTSFERLLAALASNPEQAALEYEQLRHRIIGLLQWWGASESEELADRTLDRVARKLDEGAVIPEGSLGAYVRGVARMVHLESIRQRAQTGGLEREWTASRSVDAPEAPHACLEHCLTTLTDDERQLVIRYYGPGKKAEVRRQLARELGISATALRIRTHRLRERLERCVAGCRDDR